MALTNNQTWGILGSTFIVLLVIALRSPTDAPAHGGPTRQSKGSHMHRHHKHTPFPTPDPKMTERNGAVMGELESETAGAVIGQNSVPVFTAPAAAANADDDDGGDDDGDELPMPPKFKEGEDGRSINPYIDKHISAELRQYWKELEVMRRSQSEMLHQHYNSWCNDCNGDCKAHNCWNHTLVRLRDHWPNEAQTDFKPMAECNCKDHTYDNRTTWDFERTSHCRLERDNLEKKFPFPKDLMAVRDMNYNLKKDAPDMGIYLEIPSETFKGGTQVPCPSFGSGKAVGELPYDPAKVKDYFQQLRAMLALHYQGEDQLENRIRPIPGEPHYPEYIDGMAARFAGALVHGGDFVIGATGDSTVAGADNCFFDAWINAICRQIGPLFGAAKVNLTCVNGGHNGGYDTTPKMSCANGIFGEDMDIMIAHQPFIGPARGYFTYEDFIRRSLISGAVAIKADGRGGEGDFLLNEPYFKHGVFVGGDWRLTGELREPGYKWYPDPGRGHWGRMGDGTCHVFSTRAGSGAIMQRNWHPGPLGHELIADQYMFIWADAIVKALADIEHAIKASGGKINPLKAKWPRRVKVDPKTLPRPVSCSEEKDNPVANGGMNEDRAFYENTWRQVCGKDATIDLGLAKCVSSLGSVRARVGGNPWTEWVVPNAEAPIWEKGAADNGNAWGLDKSGPKSTCGRGNANWVCKGCNKPEECDEDKYAVSGDQGYAEPLRIMDDQCTHQDYEFRWSVGEPGGWATFKIRKDSMKVGAISICAACADGMPPKVILRGKGMEDGQEYKFEGEYADGGNKWDRDDWGNQHGTAGGKCGQVTRKLDPAALSDDILMGINCFANQTKGKGAGFMSYILTQ